MKLILRDIGPIKESELILDKLTVLAGRNGTGKSIAARLLYISLLGLTNYVDFWIERVDMLLRALEVWSYEYKVSFKDSKGILRRIRRELERWRSGASLSMDRLSELRSELLSSIKDKLSGEFLLRSFLDSFERYFPERLSDERAVRESMIVSATEWLFNEEFEETQELVRFGSKEGYLSLSFPENSEEERLEVYLERGGALRVFVSSAEPFSLPVVYLVGSYLNLLPLGEIFILKGEEVDLPFHFIELIRDFKEARAMSVSRDKLKIYEKLLSELEEVIGGSFLSNEGELYFRRMDGETISSVNLASGERVLASLHVFLKRLLGTYDRFILIFDEPETHLHPQWQVELAKFLVKLAKLGVPILISTHSPYVVQAIRFFSHDVDLRVNYVMAFQDDDGVILRDVDVSEESNLMIRELSKPFMRLVWR